MKRKQLIAVSIFSICLFTSACGGNTTDTEAIAVVQNTETQQAEIETENISTESIEESLSELTEQLDDTTPTFEIVEQGDYPDTRSDHQKNWDIYKNYFDDFSVYGTDTAGKEYNDLPYCGDTGYDPKGTILQERTTDKGYTVMYDTNTGKVYYSSMILPTGSGYDDLASSKALVQYILDNDIFSVYDLTYSQYQEILGVYNGN